MLRKNRTQYFIRSSEMNKSKKYDLGKVSVIMPAYNAEKYIEQAARSVLDQSYQNIELIIVDDGSSDSTANIAQSIVANDERAKLVEQKNSGKPSIARNVGIKFAAGQYLSFLDSDDYWLPERVAKLLDGMGSHPDWIASFHDLKFITFDDRLLPGTYLHNVNFPSTAHPHLVPIGNAWHESARDFFIFMSTKYAAIHTQSVLIDRHKFNRDDLQFNEKFTICEDTDLWIRLAMNGKIGYLDHALSFYRQNPESITKNPIRFAEQALMFHQFNRSRILSKLDQKNKSLYAQKIADLARQAAYHYGQAGLLKQARSSSKLAFRQDAKMIDIIMLAKTFIPQRLRDIYQ